MMDISKGSAVGIILIAIVGGYLIASIIVLLRPNWVYPKRRFSSKTRKDGRATTKNKETENTREEAQPLLDDTYRQDVPADVHIPPVAPSAETGILDVDKRPQTKDIHLRKQTVATSGDDEVFTFRHQYLLFECGTNILSKVYDYTVGDKFGVFFDEKTLKDLVKKYPLTEKQEKLLLPDGKKASSPSSSDFDFDILCCLLNNLTDRKKVTNLVVAKNVKLLKSYKNMLMQRGSVCESSDDNEFRKLIKEDGVYGSSGSRDTKWKILCKIFRRLPNELHGIQVQWIDILIDEASTVEMDDYLKRQYKEMVRSWSEMGRVLECGVGEFQSQCMRGQKQLNLITSMVETALCTDTKADVREERVRLLVSSDEVTEKPLDAKRYSWEMEDPVVDVVKTTGTVSDTGGELDREIITALSVVDQCMKDQELLEEKMTTMMETDTVKPSQPMDETCPQPDIVCTFRYQYLLLDVGTKILCAVFDKKVDSDFKQYLANHPNAEHQLDYLIRRRVITTKQAMLIPPEKNPTSANFDLPLLYCLLRHVCGLKHYSDTVWISPDERDDSIEACITRLRCCGNELMHCSIMFDSESDFTVKWDKLCMILRKLDEFGGNVNKQLIDDAHGKSFTDSVKERYEQTLTTWLEMDRIGEYGVGELVSMMNLYVDGQERVYRKISQLLETVEKKTELMPSFKVRYRNRSTESGQHHESTHLFLDEPVSYEGQKSGFTFRYQYLLIEVGTKILRAVFDLLVGDNFKGYLDKNEGAKKQLKELIDKKIIPKEKHGLFVRKPTSLSFELKKPTSLSFELKNPTSSNFDLSLLCCLLRYVCGLKPPSDEVWISPADDDYSTEACITRLEICRNALVHSCTVYESETELQDKWNQLVKILTPLRDYSGMKETVQELVNQAETVAIDVKQKKRVSEELRNRQEKDEMFQHRLREVISKLDQCIKSQERLEVMVTHWIETRINSQRQEAESSTDEDHIDNVTTEFERLVMEGHCVVECTVRIDDGSVVVVSQTGENVEFEDVMKSMNQPTILNIETGCMDHLVKIVECVQHYDKMEYVIWGSSREIRRQITELDDEIRIFKRPTLKLYAYYFTCFLPFVYFDNLVLLISHSFSTEDTSRLSQLRQWLSNKFLLSLSPMVNHLKKRGIRTYLVHTDRNKANNERFPSSVALQIKQISALSPNMLPAHCQRDPSPTNSQLDEDYNVNRPESPPPRVASPSSFESEYFESNETAVTLVSSESMKMTAGQTV